jgi:hypothetical protein
VREHFNRAWVLNAKRRLRDVTVSTRDVLLMVKGTVPEVGLLDSDLDVYGWVTRITDLLVLKELDTCVEQDVTQLATEVGQVAVSQSTIDH